MSDRLGDAPIEPRYYEQMNGLAQALDVVLNGDAKGKDRTVGFILMVFPYGTNEGRCNYISNGADRRDVFVMLKEQIRRFEGLPEMSGTA